MRFLETNNRKNRGSGHITLTSFFDPDRIFFRLYSKKCGSLGDYVDSSDIQNPPYNKNSVLYFRLSVRIPDNNASKLKYCVYIHISRDLSKMRIEKIPDIARTTLNILLLLFCCFI